MAGLTTLKAAVKDVKDSTRSLREAALYYGIERSKLWRVVKGVQHANALIGRPRTIPREVEEVLGHKVMHLVKSQICLELDNLPLVMMQICDKLRIPSTTWLGCKKWIANFFSRHPELCGRTSCRINRARDGEHVERTLEPLCNDKSSALLVACGHACTAAEVQCIGWGTVNNCDFPLGNVLV